MIRRAVPGEGEQVRAIVAAAYARYLDRMDKMPAPMLDDYEVRVGEGAVEVWDDPERGILGMIILGDRADGFMLENVAVSPDAQGMGIGRRLIDHAEAEARRRGHRQIRLYTHATMVENQRMYARLGYVETARGEDEGYDRVQFEKHLG
ncbi:MAG: GNAT family N-acetyltransferase [Pseudomonadota bacterium]